MLDDEQLNRAYRYALALTGQRDDAHDLVQSGVTRLLERDCARVTDVLAYLMRTMRNLYFDALRRQQRVEWSPMENLENVPALDFRSLEQLVVDADEARRLMQMLEPAERELLYLWAVEGYTAEEIAQQCGVARGTILSRIFRMRQRLLALQTAPAVAP